MSPSETLSCRSSKRSKSHNAKSGSSKHRSAFLLILEKEFLFSYITSFQDGRRYKDWTGDQVILNGPLKWLYERKDLDLSLESLDLAARRGDLNAVAYLHKVLLWPLSERSIFNAFQRGDL